MPSQGAVLEKHVQRPLYAVLAADLDLLLEYATNSEDKLWAYLNCAVETLLDEEVALEQTQRLLTPTRIPRTLEDIFGEIFKVSNFNSGVVCL